MSIVKDPKDRNFYRSFEDKFRGPRELVKSRLRVYLPFLAPWGNAEIPARAVDLGCGRGEWLELLAENGFVVQGVDLDDGMLAACRDLGLPVLTGEALAFLRSLPDDSQAVVSAFHLVEHLPFDSVLELVDQALRVLQPGGLLILETPNSENLVVGTTSFYLDPTHQRPIPSQLLAFIPEHAGFRRTKIARLQESKELSGNPAPSLLNVLNGVSPDYAVIAQKDGAAELLDVLTAAFDGEYGLSLETLAKRYQAQAEEKARQAEAESRATVAEARAAAAEAESRAAAAEAESRAAAAEAESRAAAAEAESRAAAAEARAAAAEAESRATVAEARAAAAEARAATAEAESRAAVADVRVATIEAELEVTRKELHGVHQANHHHWHLADARHQQLQALLNSTSWRITAPSRWVCMTLRRPIPLTLKLRVKVLLQHAALYVGRRPKLKRVVLSALNRSPALRARLAPVVVGATATSWIQSHGAQADLAALTPRARQIYADLKSAIEQREGKR